ncbi:MAG: cyclic nucleotide-binding domain-containing protein [Myxococcota bacterium]
MSGGLERFALLAGLSESGRRVLAERLDWLDVESGTQVFEEGEPADALLLVLEGRIRLWSERRQADGEVGPGSALGALSLVVEGPREATARTLTACRLLRLTREGFVALRTAAPEAACKLLEGVVRESAVFARDALAHLSDRAERSVDRSPASQ